MEFSSKLIQIKGQQRLNERSTGGIVGITRTSSLSWLSHAHYSMNFRKHNQS